LIARVRSLEDLPVEAVILPEAEAALAEWGGWIKEQPDEDDIKGRLQVLILRNALHLGWLLDRPAFGSTGSVRRVQIDGDIIQRAVKIAKYALATRREKRPLVGDNASAVMENSILRVMKKLGTCNRSDLYRKVNGDRLGRRIFNMAIDLLEGEGLVRIEEKSTKGRQAQVLIWLG